MTSLCATVLAILLMVLSPVHAAGAAFNDAVPGRPFMFPQDHGKHPEFQTEWWYFTGNVKSRANQWGFQLTFFRRSLVKQPPSRRSAWSVRDLYPGHFALTDVTNQRFYHTELLSRQGPGLAEAAPDSLKVRIRDWSATQRGEGIHLKARQNGYALDLVLIPEKPLVLHGNKGYSLKGASDDQASYYYSFTRLKAKGTITFQGRLHRVTGYAWMDHEFGSSILKEDQTGWDWFSLQLDDGTELMLFYLRKKDGSPERPFGTFVPKQGSPVDLAPQQIVVSSTQTWKSPHTKAVYPARWEIAIPQLDLSLKVSPLAADQELSTGGSTSIVYWEGAVGVTGFRHGKPVRGRGYVELTGYAHSLGGRL